MTNPNPNVPTRFQPGNAGRPRGARSRLGEKFLAALADDFEAHGEAVIERVRVDSPDVYVSTVAKLLPKEIVAAVQIDQRAPGNLDPEQWARFTEIMRMVERVAPSGTSPDAVLSVLEHALRSELATPLPQLEVLPTLLPCPIALPVAECAQDVLISDE